MVRYLLQLDNTELHFIDQCQWGASAKKPTGLMTIHLPELKQCISASPNGGKFSHRGHQAAYGRDKETGGFRSAPLKQYPTKLCRMFAAAIAQHSTEHVDRNWCPWPMAPDFARFFVPLDPFMTFSMGADYHR